MPIDLSPYIAEHAIEPQQPHAVGGGTYEVHKDGLQNLLVKILEAQFPDLVAAGNGKLLNKSPGPGAVMDYAPVSGEIRGKPRSGYGTDYIVDRSKIGNVTGVRGATTDQVVDNLGSLLHEFYHARAAKGPGNYSKGLATQGNEWKVLLENAITAGFPSISTTYGGGDKLEEFLASAVAVKHMEAKGIQPVNRWAAVAQNLKQLESLHPWLADYITQWEAPEKQRKESPK